MIIGNLKPHGITVMRFFCILISQPEDMPARDGRPCTVKRMKRVFKQVKVARRPVDVGFATTGAEAETGAPHTITVRSIFPAEGDPDE